ncbi:MAG TPA: anthranilate synthase component I [Bacteroidota bacterium]
MISYEKFEELAKDYNVVPLEFTTMADLHTPVSAYLAVRESGVPSFLLETVEPNEKIGRYSFIGLKPLMTIRARGNNVAIDDGSQPTEQDGNIFSVLARLANRYHQAPPETPDGFLGGFVGYIGYDNVRHLEKLPMNGLDRAAEDDAALGLYASIIRFDHRSHLMTIVHNVLVNPHEPLRAQYDRGTKAVEALELRLRKSSVATQSFRCDLNSLRENPDRETYCDAVKRAKRHIFEGDIFQVVLSRRVQLQFTGDLFPVYRALRTINPSPYLFFLDFGETTLIGSSPEVLVKVQDRSVEVFPIAGTRRRGATESEDLLLEQELLADTKELAEHVMLVDLGRNDVGRISEFGTVSVPVFKRIERYSHVMHIVSEVRGKLKSDATALDALRACFPAGTVSGAPKVRAMEIIHELEPVNRGTYAGAVGYIGFNGSLDTCIAIRTIVAHRNTLMIQAGAGIVADSVPEREYEESVNKSRALLDAIKMAANGLSPTDLIQNSPGDRR